MTRAGRYHFEEDRRRFVAGRITLRRLLAERTGTAAKELVIEEAENGKPRLPLPDGTPPVYFNVSHSGDYAVVALTDAAEVGVDIEEMRADCPVGDLARRFYSAREAAWLESLTPQERLDAFYRLWTIKEAVLKCAGLGLSLPPRYVEVGLAGDRPPTITCLDPRHKALERFRVMHLALVEGYASGLSVADEAEIGVFLVRP